jgi:hypothetical protein
MLNLRRSVDAFAMLGDEDAAHIHANGPYVVLVSLHRHNTVT